MVHIKLKTDFFPTSRSKNVSEFNPISYLLSFIATTGMLLIALYYIGSNKEWAIYSGMQFFLGIIGIISVQAYRNKRWMPPIPERYAVIHPEHIQLSITVYIIILLIQIVGGIFRLFFSPANIVELMYIVFSAVCEELFFRGAVLGLFIWLAKGYKKHYLIAGTIISSGLFVSSLLFMGYHTIYYGDPILLTVVFVGGLCLGWSYVKSNDIMVPILAHFLLNLSVVVQNLLV